MLNASPFRSPNRPLALCATVVVAAALALAWLVMPATASATASCALSEMSSTSQPACWHAFSGGPFNTELSSDPALAPNSAAVVSHMTTYNWSVGPPGGGFSLGSGSRPVFFASPSDPAMKIVCEDDFGAGSCTGANGVNIAGQSINVPAGAQAQDASDGHLTVIETATGDEYDFWNATIDGSTIEAGTGSMVNVNTGNGLGSQGDAADFALTGGLLRPSELASGTIDHALVVSVPCVNATGASGYSYPASGGNGEVCGDYWSESPSGAPELGQLLRLNLTAAQIAASPAPAWEKTVMTALANYGAYIEDTDGSYDGGIDIITQDSASWTDLGLPDQWAALGDLSSSVPIPASELEVINACAPEGTCPASVVAPPVATPAATPAATTPPPAASTPSSAGKTSPAHHKNKKKKKKKKKRKAKHNKKKRKAKKHHKKKRKAKRKKKRKS
jgi:hypothetical protein